MSEMTEKHQRERTGSVTLREELEENISKELNGPSALPENQNSFTGSVTSNSARRDKPKDDSSSEGHAGDALNKHQLVRKGTYKEQKRLYKEEKKRLTDEILQCLSESTFLIESGWLKARTTIKTWTKIWCELKPGGLILYRNERVNEMEFRERLHSDHGRMEEFRGTMIAQLDGVKSFAKITKTSVWIGTILLNVCRIIERPSKKEGYCFKIYHPLDQNIWASKGPHGETLKGLSMPLPVGHVILRAVNDVKGREWLSSIELVLKHSPEYFTHPVQGTLRDSVRRTVSNGIDNRAIQRMRSESETFVAEDGVMQPESPDTTRPASSHWNDTDSQEEEEDEDDYGSVNGSSPQAEQFVEAEDHLAMEETPQTPYTLAHQEELGQHGKGLEQSFLDEEKSIFWTLLKQVRPGMDLSKVVLPTFILDPRSLLDKLSDYYYHADLISKAAQCDSPFERMKGIVVWYLSGFYKKPKGVKKPYNPLLGEVFRCAWDHPSKDSRTFYIAEQVSHHPPISAFYVSNRQEGFTITGAILTKSKYKGNSILAILDGSARLRLLSRGEEYIVTMPHLICKGMLFGKLSMDLGGHVTINCPTTGYHTELNFSVWLTRTINPVEGKIRLGNEVMASLQGSWDGEIYLTDAKTKEEDLCWKPIPEARLNRLVVPIDCQRDFESEKLWSRVTAALDVNKQEDATTEKSFLEDNQRKEAKERAAMNETWTPRFFVKDEYGEWTYKHAEGRPWDSLLDQYQYEHDFVVQTKLRLQGPAPMMASDSKVDTLDSARGGKNAVRHGSKLRRRNVPVDSDTSSGSPTGRPDGINGTKAGASSNSHVPSRSETSLWPAIQALQTQQTQILAEIQTLRPVLQKLSSQTHIERRLASLAQQFRFFFWTIALIGVSSILTFIYRLL